jgi:hypothetical protein
LPAALAALAGLTDFLGGMASIIFEGNEAAN